MVAFLFPGQGAQKVGMAQDFYEQFQVARHLFEEAGDAQGVDFAKLIFTSSQQELAETKNAQPAIFVASMAIFQVVRSLYPQMDPTIVAGLSLGEYCALTAGGYMSLAEALNLVMHRGAFMQEAAESNPGGLLAALGVDEEHVRMAIGQKGWIANLNTPGQVVVATHRHSMEEMTTSLKAAGARKVIELDVSGAFHSPLMMSARNALERFLTDVSIHKGSAVCVMNVTAKMAQHPEEVRGNLVEQMCNPVRWEESIRLIDQQEKSGLMLECGPGDTLTRMNKKIGVQSVSLNIESVADLDKIGVFLKGASDEIRR